MSEKKYDEKFFPNRVPELEWRDKARENLQKWGVQSFKELLLAIQEELGELTKAYLEHDYEDGEFEVIKEELDDLMALGYQFKYKINQEGDSTDE